MTGLALCATMRICANFCRRKKGGACCKQHGTVAVTGGQITTSEQKKQDFSIACLHEIEKLSAPLSDDSR